VTFDVSADAYGRFMGRFSEPLAGAFVDAVGLEPARTALDVGCGPGALTAVLVDALGVDRVSAAEPSAPFVAAVRERLPGLDVRRAPAEDLPFADAAFDLALAQLVVHFMADPVAGLREMARVTRPGGRVAATVWDYEGRTGPLSTFWAAVKDLDPTEAGESLRAGTREGQLASLLREAGLREVTDGRIAVTSRFGSFEEWWEPYTLGVGPAGSYVASLESAARDRLRDRCASLLPDPPFEVGAAAWFAVGVV
jgi:SAM-dependent methyltransferase